MHERIVNYIDKVSCPRCGNFNTAITGGDNDGGVYYECKDCGCLWEEYGYPIVRRII